MTGAMELIKKMIKKMVEAKMAGGDRLAREDLFQELMIDVRPESLEGFRGRDQWDREGDRNDPAPPPQLPGFLEAAILPTLDPR